MVLYIDGVRDKLLNLSLLSDYLFSQNVVVFGICDGDPFTYSNVGSGNSFPAFSGNCLD